ncbi:MAG: ribosome maturation factor RimP [Paenibacillaceae bacterium]
MSQSIISTIDAMIRPMLDENGFELVDIEFVKEGGNRFLRVIVDKPNGIDIDDCSKISEYVSEKLDEQDPITEAYFLEVTSPGAERPLKKSADFHKSVNLNVFITTHEEISGKKEFEGILSSFDEENLVIKAGKKIYTLPYSKVATARQSIVF